MRSHRVTPGIVFNQEIAIVGTAERPDLQTFPGGQCCPVIQPDPRRGADFANKRAGHHSLQGPCSQELEI